jgi:hypothetical protein
VLCCRCRWTQTHSGIGAGIDSFYEYLLKAYIMFGDEEMLEWSVSHPRPNTS